MNKERAYFRDLDLSWIRTGVVFLDVEGTLVPNIDQKNGTTSSQRDLPDDETVRKVRELSSRATVYLISNSADTARRERIAAAIGTVVYHKSTYRKPDPRIILDLMPHDGRPAFVIGDTLLTDGLLAYRVGVPFIRTRSLRTEKESFLLRLNYRVQEFAEKVIAFFLPSGTLDSRLTLLTEMPYTIQHPTDMIYRLIKRSVRLMLGNAQQDESFEGSKAALYSLRRGLVDLGIQYQENPWMNRVSRTVGVLGGASVLRWALASKQKGFIKSIVAGPFVVGRPSEENGLMKQIEIDTILFASAAEQSQWAQEDQMFRTRGAVWTPGVDICEAGGDTQGHCIIYTRDANEKLFHAITQILWERKMPIIVSEYGKFKKSEYLRLLRTARMVIHISSTQPESAVLYQAWMANVPTLSWRDSSETVNIPATCGLAFTDEHDFANALDGLLTNPKIFDPRTVALGRHTHKIAAQQYLKLLNSL